MAEFILGTEDYPLVDRDVMTEEIGLRTDSNYLISLSTNIKAPQGVDFNDYLYGQYIRNLPVRSLLASANDEIDRRNIHNDAGQKTYASGFLGAPGTGKTFFFSNLGRLLHSKGPVLVDCSAKDMQTLFENPTFDSSSTDKEKAAIDAKIKCRNAGMTDGLSDESLEMLKSAAGEAVVIDEEGKVSVDWNAVRFEAADMRGYEYQAQVFQNMLKNICRREDVDLGSGKSEVGIVMKDGELFRVFDPNSPDYGRPVILDELNRAKHGTMDNLYGLLNFLNSPNMKTFKLTGANNREIVVNKAKIPSTFYLNFTGNQAVEGMGSGSFNDPFLSRVPEGFMLKTIPDLIPGDYADMICSYLMGGVPGVILYDAFTANKKHIDMNEFTRFLKSIREIGLTKAQVKEIPLWQRVNIQNADKIIKLSQKLGSFFYEIKQLIGLRGKSYEKINIDPEYEAVLNKKSIDFRTIAHFFIEAERLKGSIESGDRIHFPRFSKGNKHTSRPAHNAYNDRGERLEKVMDRWLKSVFVPDDSGLRCIDENQVEEMYKRAQNIAIKYGILRDSKKLYESKNNEDLLSNLYNAENVYQTDPSYQDNQVRDLYVSIMRKKYPDIADESDEDVLPIRVVNMVMGELADGENEMLNKVCDSGNLMVFNEDIDNVKSKFVAAAEIKQNTQAPCITTENFLMSISVEPFGDKNLANLFKCVDTDHAMFNWDSQDVDYMSSGDDAADDITSLKIGFFKTSTLKGDDDYLFIMYNKSRDKMVVIGSDVHPAVLKHFESDKRKFINRATMTDSQFSELCEDEFGVPGLCIYDACTKEDWIKSSAEDAMVSFVKYLKNKKAAYAIAIQKNKGGR